MADKTDVLARVRAALQSEPRVDLHRHPIAMGLDDDGALTLEDEVRRY